MLWTGYNGNVLDSTGSGQRTMAGSHGNEFWGSIKGEKIFDEPSGC
jgi:hypothetical protein